MAMRVDHSDDAQGPAMALDPSRAIKSASEATVYLPTPFHPESEALAEEKFKTVLRPGTMTEEECLAVCDGILCRTWICSREKLLLAKRAQIVSRNGTGLDNVHLDTCREKGIAVTRVPSLNAKSVAELTLTLMLNTTRRVKELDSRICKGELFDTITVISPGLFGATVGLVGMGSIAYEVAKLLTPFGCTLLVHAPGPPPERWTVPDARLPVAIPHQRVSLAELLSAVDVLSVHCPLSTSTRNLIAHTELGLMKSRAVVINTARGGIIDERALADALRSGQIAGAGLDVFEVEPAHGETLGELGKMDNVICLPHVGASTDRTQAEACSLAVEIMADFFDGRPVRNRVC